LKVWVVKFIIGRARLGISCPHWGSAGKCSVTTKWLKNRVWVKVVEMQLVDAFSDETTGIKLLKIKLFNTKKVRLLKSRLTGFDQLSLLSCVTYKQKKSIISYGNGQY
jgi:hypothetical protein